VDCQAEACISSVLGTYHFDFSRALATSMGPNSSKQAMNYKQVRFGRGSMCIKRIDTGATTGLVLEAASAYGAMIPVNLGVKATLLRLHYIRLAPGENSSMFSSRDIFLADPRRRQRFLRQGRQIRFSFSPMSTMNRHIQTVTRQDVGGFESTRIRDLTLPQRPKRLGFIPMGCVSQINASGTLEPIDGTTQGLGTDLFRLISSEMVFMFEWDGAAPFSYTFPGTDPPRTANVCNMMSPLVWRNERCRITMRGTRAILTKSVGMLQSLQTYPTSSAIPFLESVMGEPSLSNATQWDPNTGTGGSWNPAGGNFFSCVPAPLSASNSYDLPGQGAP